MSTIGTIDEILDEMVLGGRLSEDEARDIASAPRIRFEIREVISYLAAVIIGLGTIRLIVALVEDADPLAVAGVLYVAAALFGWLSVVFASGSAARQRFGEVSEVVATLAAAIATGIVLNEADLRGEVCVLVPAAVALAWGLFRSRSTEFSGSATIVPGLIASTISLANLLEFSQDVILLCSVGCAVTLIALGLSSINAAVLPRLAGAVMLIFTTPSWVGEHSDDGWAAVGFIVGITVFTLGVVRLRPELLLSAGIVITASVAIVVFENVENDVAQGLIVLAIGLLMLGVTTAVVRRGGLRRRSPGAPSVSAAS